MIEMQERRKWAHAKITESLTGSGDVIRMNHYQARLALKSHLEQMMGVFETYEYIARNP